MTKWILIIALIALALYLYWKQTAQNCCGSCGSVFMKLNAQQISVYAQNAGFSGNDAILAVAVALAESGGDTAIKGDLNLAPTKGPSVGLWQIDVGSKEHPELAALDLTDPQTNANAAYKIWERAGGEFTPWSTFNNSAYLKFLPQAAQAVNGCSCGNGGCACQ